MNDQDSNDVDWGRVFAEAVAIALNFTKRDVEDLVQDAMVLFLAGEAPLDPAEKKTLAEHLVSVGLYARRKKERTERRRRHPGVIGKIVHMFDRPPPTPEGDYTEAEDCLRKTRLFEELVVDLEDDPEAREIVLLAQQGVHEALEQAKRSGMDIEVVRNARKRIKRRMEALAEGDKEET